VPEGTIRQLVNRLQGPTVGGVDAAIQMLDRIIPPPPPPRQENPSPFAGPGSLEQIQQGILSALAQALPVVGAIARQGAEALPLLASTIYQGAELTGRLPSGSYTFGAQRQLAQEELERTRIGLERMRIGIAREQLRLAQEAARAEAEGRMEDAEARRRWMNVTADVSQLVEQGRITNRAQLIAELTSRMRSDPVLSRHPELLGDRSISTVVDYLLGQERAEEDDFITQLLTAGDQAAGPGATITAPPREALLGVERINSPAVVAMVDELVAEGASDDEIMRALVAAVGSRQARQVFNRLRMRVDQLRRSGG